MPRIVGVLLVVMALAACSTEDFQEPVYTPRPAPVAPPAPPAPAAIVGHGAYHREGGAVVSCAGFSVALMPDSPRYARRMEALYGPPAARLMEPVSEVKARSAKLPPATDNVEPLATSTCDIHGAFAFGGVPAGGYFLIAHVKQKPAPTHVEDYVILERVMLEPGQTSTVSLAP